MLASLQYNTTFLKGGEIQEHLDFMCFVLHFYLRDSVFVLFLVMPGHLVLFVCFCGFFFSSIVEEKDIQSLSQQELLLGKYCYLVNDLHDTPCALWSLWGFGTVIQNPLKVPFVQRLGMHHQTHFQDLISHLSGQMALPSDRCSNQRIQLCLSASDASAFFPDKKMHCELNCLYSQQCHKLPHIPCLCLLSIRVTQATAKKHHSDFSQPIL